MPNEEKRGFLDNLRKEINRRRALSLTCTGIIAALGGAAASCHPAPAAAIEHPAARARRLARELSTARDEYSADAGSPWKAHVYPASYRDGAVEFQNLDPACNRSSIMPLFREWQTAWDRCNDHSTPEQEADQLLAMVNELEARMLALPSTSAADMAAKFIAYSGHGDYVIEDNSPFWKEALALVGGAS